MILLLLRLWVITESVLVSISELDKSRDHAVLYTKSSEVQQSFLKAVQSIPLACSYKFCFDDADCALQGTSSMLVSLQGVQHPYTWEYNLKDFSEFFNKISQPVVAEINSTESFEWLSSKKVGFLFVYFFQSELEEFIPIAKKFLTSHMYFGAAFNETYERKQSYKRTYLRLVGLDGIFKHSCSGDYEGFIERFKCPMLLEYLEADWVYECFDGKVVVTSVINKRRKHMWDLYAGKLKVLATELNDTSFQMMYVDSRRYAEYMKYYEIPFIPFFLIHDYRISKSFYFGELNFKSHKRFLKLLNDVKEFKLRPEDYTIDNIQFTNYINIWQLIPLAFLGFGIILIFYSCYRSTFEKEKIN